MGGHLGKGTSSQSQLRAERILSELGWNREIFSSLCKFCIGFFYWPSTGGIYNDRRKIKCSKHDF